MINKWIALLCCVVGLVGFSTASADTASIPAFTVPPGMQSEYTFDTSHDDILQIKKEMQLLGYFSADAELTGRYNNTMKERVIQFQKNNHLPPNGRIDSAFLSALYGQSVIAKNGAPYIRESPPDAIPSSLTSNSSALPASPLPSTALPQTTFSPAISFPPAETASDPDSFLNLFLSSLPFYTLPSDPTVLYAWGFCIASFALCFLSLFIFLHRKRQMAYVKRHSTKYAALIALNESYVFYPLENQYTLYKNFSSKASYDRADFDQFMLETTIKSSYLQDLSATASYNQSLFAHYCDDYNQLPPSEDHIIACSHIRKKRFLRLENSLCDSIFQCPVSDISVTVVFAYTSPHGRNSYHRQREYSHAKIQNILQQLESIRAYQQSKDYQRALMTPSLRYDVMKRDQFRCCICGISAQEGAKLHVDHILPVSRGGKTELNNLRTLCDRCNLGKRDKYDEWGPN